MDDVGHQLLEARVLHAGHTLGALEIGRRLVAARLALAGVVDQELGHLAERAAFLAVVDDEARAAVLGLARRLLDAVRQVGAAGADVRAEDVGAVALVVDAAGEGVALVADVGRVAEHVEGDPADRWQEDLQVRPGDELGIHAAGLFEECAAKLRLFHLEALGDARQIPDRIDGGLGHRHVAALVDHLAVDLQAALGDGLVDLRQVDARLGDRDGRADVDAFGQLDREVLGDPVTPGVEADDLPRLMPLRVRADGHDRVGVVQFRPSLRGHGARRDRQRAVDRIGAAMGANGVAVGAGVGRRDDRPALPGGGGVPVDGEAAGRPGPRVGGEPNVGCPVGGHGSLCSLRNRKGPPASSPA